MCIHAWCVWCVCMQVINMVGYSVIIPENISHCTCGDCPGLYKVEDTTP